MTSAVGSQPRCEKCRAALPWDDVDRVIGQCKACGAAFDFSVPEPTAEAALAAGAPAVPPAMEIVLPLARGMKPPGVEIALGPPFEITWRRLGGREILAIVFAIFADTMFVVSAFVMKDILSAGIFLVIGGSVTIVAKRALQGRTRLTVSDDAIRARQRTKEGERETRLTTAHVARFFCEDGTATVPTISSLPLVRPEASRRLMYVSALLFDSRCVRLVVDIEDRPVAVYLTQILQERLDSIRARL